MDEQRATGGQKCTAVIGVLTTLVEGDTLACQDQAVM